MKNIIDITSVTDKILDIFLNAKSNPDCAIDVSHLTAEERAELANLMGWKQSCYLSDWVGTDNGDHLDYEGAILDQQSDESWGC